MVNYEIQSFEPPTHITFLINGNISHRVNMTIKFPDYCILPEKDFKQYYKDIDSNELIIVENIDEMLLPLRGAYKGLLNVDGKYYRKAIQSDIDRNEEKYNSENWGLYQYLVKYYESYEIFLSEDRKISIHIRKSENEKDLILERFEKDENEIFNSVYKLCLQYAVRELNYCNAGTLKGKYEELINKNLKSYVIRKDLLPYVEGVFKVEYRY